MLLTILLTNSIDEAYQAIQSLVDPLQGRIKLSTTDNLERERLKCLVWRLTHVSPMTARGYFTISKETLVSMLSVRKGTIMKIIRKS